MASLNHATIIKGFEKLAGDRDPENFFDSSGICVGSSSPDFGQREPVNKYGESPR